MTRISARREYDDLTNEEVDLITSTVERRIGGMFNRSRHPNFRTKKGTRRSASGTIFGPTKDTEWLVKYARRNISRRGPLADAAITNTVIRKVIRRMVMDATITFAAGQWHMDADFMSVCNQQSQQLSDQARARKQKERTNGGYVPPVQRQRRRVMVA